MIFKILLILVLGHYSFFASYGDIDIMKLISESDKRYCAIKCATVNHTMCNSVYPPGGPEGECTGFLAGFTAEEKVYVLEMHNELRRQIATGEITGQPVGANVLMLKWDDELANIAQRLADQCNNNENDICRLTLAGEDSGQNLQSITADTRLDAINQIMKRWFDQHNSFNPERFLEKYDRRGDSASMYAQLVWAKTTRVGCGFIAKVLVLDGQFRMACNYIVRGRVNGEPVYLKGMPCTKCPEGSHCSLSKPGLCTTDPKDCSNSATTFTNLRKFTLIPLALYFINL